MKKSEKFWWTFLIILTIAGDIVGYRVITTEQDPTSLYCGTVVYKSADEVTIKHGTRTDLYLGVDFDDVGRHAIEVGVDTYMSKKVGDTVCFNLTNYQVGKEGPNMAWLIAKSFFGVMAALSTLVIIVLIIGNGVEAFNEWLDSK